MERFRIRTRYQREKLAVTPAGQLKKNQDAKVAAIGECIVYVLAAPIQLVDGAVLKLLRVHTDLQAALGLEVTELAPKLDFPEYEVADAGMEQCDEDEK